MQNLTQLIDSYGALDSTIKDMTKESDKYKAELKDALSAIKSDTNTYTGEKYQVQLIESTRETMDEDKVLTVVRTMLPVDLARRCIKTREYVDMAELEAALYTGEIDMDAVEALNRCRITKTIVSLKCKPKKAE